MGVEHPSWSLAGGWLDRGEQGPWELEQEQAVPLLERPVLVTAFGPFPGQPVNPSELVVDELAGDEDVVSHVLDVSYRRAPAQLDGLVRMVDPVAVVCFGVAASATAVRLERFARDRDESRTPDVDGDVGAGRRIDRGPLTVQTRLDLDAIQHTLTAAGIPTERSEDAGGYVCNHLMRHALTDVALLDRPVGFVHVPRLGAPGFDASTFGLVGRLVVGSVVSSVLGGASRGHGAA